MAVTFDGWRTRRLDIAAGPSTATSPTGFPAALRPQPLEIALGLVLNLRPHAAALPRPASRDPRSALEEAARRALLRPPCLVSFSGGRDSSAVLAVATAVARRERLAPPIPITLRFPGAPKTDENDWQERVVRHLGLPDWERVAVTDELDCVGPVATDVLRRHGVLWPFNAHFHVPLFQRAAGGSLLTGVGGDELLGGQMWRVAQAFLAGRSRPTVRRVRTTAVALGPRPVRRIGLARHMPVDAPWLHPRVRAEIRRARVEAYLDVPLRWGGGVDWWWRCRARAVVARTLGRLADDAGAQLVQPLMEPSVLAAAAHRFGAFGPEDRSAAMRAIFGDLLPDAVLTRRTKSAFNEAFFTTYSRSFVASWTGGDVDRSLVDVDRLAAIWHHREPDARTFSLLQAAWHGAAARGAVRHHEGNDHAG